jgi:hypothetical protein
MGFQQKMSERKIAGLIKSKREAEQAAVDTREELMKAKKASKAAKSTSRTTSAAAEDDADGDEKKWQFRGKDKGRRGSRTGSAIEWAPREAVDAYTPREEREYDDEKSRLFFLPKDGELQYFADVAEGKLKSVERVIDLSVHWDTFMLATLGQRGQILFWSIDVEEKESGEISFSAKCEHCSRLPQFHVRQHLLHSGSPDKSAAEAPKDEHATGNRLRFSPRGKFCCVGGSTDKQESVGILYFFRIETDETSESSRPIFMNACVTTMIDFFSKEQSRKVLDTTASLSESGAFPFYGINSLIFTDDERYLIAGDGKGRILLCGLNEDESEFVPLRLFNSGTPDRILELAFCREEKSSEVILFLATHEVKTLRAIPLSRLLEIHLSTPESETIVDEKRMFTVVKKPSSDKTATRTIAGFDNKLAVGTRKVSVYEISELSESGRVIKLSILRDFERNPTRDRSISSDFVHSLRMSYGNCCVATRVSGSDHASHAMTVVRDLGGGSVERVDLNSSGRKKKGKIGITAADFSLAVDTDSSFICDQVAYAIECKKPTKDGLPKIAFVDLQDL